MNLKSLAERAGLSWPNGLDSHISGVVDHSSKVQPGFLFVMPQIDERDVTPYITHALSQGAAAVLTSSPYPDDRVLTLTDMATLHRAIGRMVSAFYGDPSLALHTFGITGTNGKTTTAWLIHQVLQKLGFSAGYLGTLGNHFGKFEKTLNNTTPFSVELLGCLTEMVRVDVRYLAMEVSSHALHQHRIAGMTFDVGVFTNLSQDHLDYHGTLDAYAAAKQLLFTEYGHEANPNFVAVLNVDDAIGQAWSSSLLGAIVPFSIQDSSVADQDGGLFGSVERLDWQSIDLLLDSKKHGSVPCRIPMGGWFNAQNGLAAIAALTAHPAVTGNFSLAQIAEAMAEATPVPGRFESVPNTCEIGVIVDYAHTPDGLIKLLDAVRPLASKRLITVFGCGGDRDRTKRPKMAAAVSMRSDYSIVTSDNPRTEDPDQIFADIAAGIVSGAAHHTTIDRQIAISEAIEMAEVGDVVVIAGKGHESYQIIGKEKQPFDDRQVAKAMLEAKKCAS